MEEPMPSAKRKRPSAVTPLRPSAEVERARRVAASRKALARSISEKQLQADVVRDAARAGWRHYHELRSKGSDKGWPDLVLVREVGPPRLLFAELKTERGVVSSEQREWLDALAATGSETYLWRPSDMEEIGRILFAPVMPGGLTTTWILRRAA